MTDESLVEAFQGGDKSAGEELLYRYKNKVLATARRFFLSGGETEDLVQEGMCGLYSAMVSYNTKKPQNSSTFSTYAYTCIKNKIVDAVRAGDSGKNQALNNFLPILEDNYPSDINPEEQLIDNEENNEFLKELKILLSDFEYKVLSMYIDGHTMGEISTALDTSKKSVDNAINRAKNKIQQKINKQS